MANYKLVKKEEIFQLWKINPKTGEHFNAPKEYDCLVNICNRMTALSPNEDNVDFTKLNAYRDVTKEDFDKILMAYFNNLKKKYQ